MTANDIALNQTQSGSVAVESQYKGMHSSGAKMVAMVLDLEKSSM